ncbi:hypothetical protein D3C85_1055240 [compost metagenome]
MFGIRDEGGGDRRVDPDAAFTLVEQCQIFIEAVGGRARRAVFLHQVDIHVDRVLPRLAGKLRLPFHVEQLAAVGIGHGGDQRHVVAPARLAAQADAVHAVGRIVQLGRHVAQLVPGRAVLDRHARFFHQVAAVHDHRAFAIERRRVQLAVAGQAFADGGQQVVDIVFGVRLDGNQPVFLAPYGRFIQADGHHVELAALGGDIGGHALAQDALFQGHPFELDVGIGLLEELAELLHFDHVAVVDGGDDQVGGGKSGRAEAAGDQRGNGGTFHCVSPVFFVVGNARLLGTTTTM